ncbi:hypothetical protein JTB14_032765 [Gonioctena quinquepunctata]|nr:hypothetical protein JTB14_032765 [Gonioctena quinquepunctata]
MLHAVYTSKEPWKNVRKPIFQQKQKWPETVLSTNTEEIKSCNLAKRNVLLRMIPVKLYGPRGEVHTLALCDEGLTVSLIEEDIVRKLGLKGIKESLCIKWTGDISTKFTMSGSSNIRSKRFETIYFEKYLYSRKSSIAISQKRKLGSISLKNLLITDFENERPMLLIGQDNINLIIPRQIRSDYTNGLVSTWPK